MMKLSEEILAHGAGDTPINLDPTQPLRTWYEQAVKLESTNADLLEALQEIAKGEGVFSLDPQKHAYNTIANMKRIATEAIREATQ